MNDSPAFRNEPAHVAALRALVYALAAGLFAFQLTGTAGIVAAVLAAIAAVPVARILAASRVRLPIVVLGSLAMIGIGLVSESVIAGSVWGARLLGPTLAITISQVVAIGCLLLGTLVVLRVLATRHALFGLLEVMIPGLLVVAIFAGHRGLRLDQPRFFSDWALANGYNPFTLLLGIGAATMAVLSILLLQTTTKLRSLAALILLATVGGGIFLLFKGCKQPLDKDWKTASSGGGGGGGAEGEQNSPDPIAVVWLHGDVDSIDGALYFRRGTRSRYTGRTLEAPDLPGIDKDVPMEFPKQPSSPPLDKVNRVFFRQVKSTVGILSDVDTPLAFVLAETLLPKENPDPGLYRLVYDVASLNLPEKYESLVMLPVGNPSWTPETRRYYLEAPKDPRYGEIVKEVESRLDETGKRSPILRALATRQWLGKQITYSLQVTHVDKSTEPDPIGTFLFETRKGSCVHIANAFVNLLRLQGIPARIGRGFMVPETRRARGPSFLIIGTDAHAWTEMFLAGVGWIIIDVACERTEEPPPPEPPPVTAQLLRKELEKLPPSLLGRAEPGEGWAAARFWWLLVVGVLGLLYLAKAWRRWAPALYPAGSLYRVAYRATLDRLADVRMVRRFGETREEFARRVEEIAPEFVAMNQAHMRRALAQKESLDAAGWKEQSRIVAARIRERVPRLRRLLGFLNPMSWIWTR